MKQTDQDKVFIETYAYAVCLEIADQWDPNISYDEFVDKIEPIVYSLLCQTTKK